MIGEAEKKSKRIINASLDWGAQLAIDGQIEQTPRSIFFDDIYFSGDGPAEARHVFIQGADLPRRFEGAGRFAIGELGFGTGLNFLTTWRTWDNAQKPPGARLHFFSVEKYPLNTDDMARAHANWRDTTAYSAKVLCQLPPPTAGLHRLSFGDVSLSLFYGDALEALAGSVARMDAWFLDGFAPAKNPDMWSPALLAEIARLSNDGATLATFTVAGAVRRGLTEAGFTIEKRPGYGRKREMLTARLAH